MNERSDTLAAHLHRLADNRAAWLKSATGTLAEQPWVSGAWVVGSLGRHDGDAFSDVDLVVAVTENAPSLVFEDPVAGLGLLGDVLFVRPKPRNAPAGGAYLAVGIDLHGLPLLVDVFLWPESTAQVSCDSTVLFAHRPLGHSQLDFIPLLAEHPSTDQRGSDPDVPGTVLMWVMLAAKHWTRGNRTKLAGICDQMGISADQCDARLLEQVLHERIPSGAATSRAVAAVRRLVTLAEHHHDGVLPR